MDGDHLHAQFGAEVSRVGVGLRYAASLVRATRPDDPGAPTLVGEAFTLRNIPAREDIDTLDVYKDYDHPQRKAIETVPPRAAPM